LRNNNSRGGYSMRDRKTITEALVITTEELIMVADEGKPPKN
jgi:hypothetical protein